MRQLLILLLFLPGFLQAQDVYIVEKKSDTLVQLQAFISKKKFSSQPYPQFYPGPTSPKAKRSYSRIINKLGRDFRKIHNSGEASDYQFQQAIKRRLTEFKQLNIADSEDEDRICLYVEELMDIVGLESSNGLLNKFRYGLHWE